MIIFSYVGEKSGMNKQKFITKSIKLTIVSSIRVLHGCRTLEKATFLIQDKDGGMLCLIAS